MICLHRRAAVWMVMGLSLAGMCASAAEPQILAPGYKALNYPAPVPGTYELPVLWSAADGGVLDERGQLTRLHALMGDKAVVMSFIYTHCNDVNGCPLATFVLSQLQGPVAADPRLKDKVRLVTLSFDPQRDTPPVIAAYGEKFREAEFDWSFLTGESTTDLAPVLADYDQSTQLVTGGDGVISHVLRVYLIDTDKQVRNVYNTSFLHADSVISDLRTILAE
ncbi:MAG: SCO family protein [Gammaproteobacteria bacterium]